MAARMTDDGNGFGRWIGIDRIAVFAIAVSVVALITASIIFVRIEDQRNEKRETRRLAFVDIVYVLKERLMAPTQSEGFPDPTVRDNSGNELYSWRFAVLPNLSAWSGSIAWDKPWE